MLNISNDLILGIDIGTSKIASVIIDYHRYQLAVSSRKHLAEQSSPPGHAEQDAEELLKVTIQVVKELPGDLRKKVRAIGLSGQMHGMVLMNKRLKPLSPLITWQDGRCHQNILEILEKQTGYRINSGFGCATLAWLKQNSLIPSEARYASTIQDLLVAQWCGLKRPLVDPTNAASWGLYDIWKQSWDWDAMKSADIPLDFLPEVRDCGSKAGNLIPSMAEILGIDKDCPIAVAIGDNQASLLATLSEPESELCITLGTGGQISAVLRPDEFSKPLAQNVRYEYRPYPAKRYMAVGACLCGGAAWEWLAAAVDSWLKDLKLPVPPRDEIYKRMNELGQDSCGKLIISPHFSGERFDLSLRGTIAGIELDNFRLGTVSNSLARGILVNLKNMLPSERMAKRNRLVGSGNALRHNPLLRQTAEQVFGLPLKLSSVLEEAACGAAINASELLLYS